MTFRNLLTASALALVLTTAGAGDAATWAQRHPRRAEVNARLAHQNARIRQGLRGHELTRREAPQMRTADRSIRAEERAAASVNGSHITRIEQREVDAQENADSRAIRNDRRIGG